MGKAAHLAIALRGILKIQEGKGMSLGGAGFQAVMVKEIFPDDMGRTIKGGPEAQVDAWLPEIDRQQLRVTIGNMQKVHIAEARQIVELPGGTFGRTRAVGKTHPSGCCYGQYLKKFTPTHHDHKLPDDRAPETSVRWRKGYCGAYLIRSSRSSRAIWPGMTSARVPSASITKTF